MSPTDRDTDQQLIVDAWVELEQQLGQLTDLDDRHVERVATAGLAAATAQDVGIRDASRDALAKLAAGTYGRCETCRGAIPLARLEAVPYARRCRVCQQQVEHGWDHVDGLIASVVRTLGAEPQGSTAVSS